MEEDERWQARGACRGVPAEIFFPERGEDSAKGLAICATCPVIKPCREWGLLYEKTGTWGGLSAAQRRIVRRERHIVLRTPEVSAGAA